jgi:hypothetical protein
MLPPSSGFEIAGSGVCRQVTKKVVMKLKGRV